MMGTWSLEMWKLKRASVVVVAMRMVVYSVRLDSVSRELEGGSEVFVCSIGERCSFVWTFYSAVK